MLRIRSTLPRLLCSLALLLFALPFASQLHAQGNNQVVLAHVTSDTRSSATSPGNVWKITVVAYKTPGGHTDGRLRFEQVYHDGQGNSFVTRSQNAPIDELIITGNTAYLRSGWQYLMLRDNGSGANAEPDAFVPLFLVSPAPTPPPLAVLRGILDSVYGFFGQPVLTGNIQIKS